MKIWIAVLEHRHGQNVYAATTKKKLVNQLYGYVVDWWDSEITSEALPAGLSKQDTIDRYFDLCQHEWLESMAGVDVV